MLSTIYFALKFSKIKPFEYLLTLSYGAPKLKQAIGIFIDIASEVVYENVSGQIEEIKIISIFSFWISIGKLWSISTCHM
jgi:hypothetical protein